ncbi:MAG: DUF469 family protein [Saccharospirillaceae bacterium]|nr:YggL family protein [Pseudomonadales bacterium]NRB81156.1 DUF469 family protein [Saccharospirillaceae bacterium]
MSTKNRRIRKKLYLDEFAIKGFELSFDIEDKSDELNDFIWELVGVVESNGMDIGGSGDATSWNGFILSSERYGSPTAENVKTVEDWLTAKSFISNVVMGDLVDANYGE